MVKLPWENCPECNTPVGPTGPEIYVWDVLVEPVLIDFTCSKCGYREKVS